MQGPASKMLVEERYEVFLVGFLKGIVHERGPYVFQGYNAFGKSHIVGDTPLDKWGSVEE